jgi:CheY-like chemotaxis protein
MRPTVVDGGAAALEAIVAASRAGRPFALMLLDANMPDPDGFEVASRLRRMPEAAGLAVMMLTSSGRSGDAARCRELGLASYAVKPVAAADLLEGIAHALPAARPDEAAGRPRPSVNDPVRERTAKPLRILLAEDNAVNQKLALAVLEQRGHHVVVAHDGKQALEKLAEHPVDLVLMDLQMPEMSGLEATAVIREQERERGGHLPIFAMTAHAMKGDRERCLEAGMDGYISKPVNRRELLETVERVPPAGDPGSAGTTDARSAA